MVQSSPPAAANRHALAIDKIRRTWRSFASSIVVTTRAAEKANGSLLAYKELDDAVVTSIRARVEFRRCCNLLEGSLTGQAKEHEALEGWLRSQPNMGTKRTPRLNGSEEMTHSSGVVPIESAIDSSSPLT